MRVSTDIRNDKAIERVFEILPGRIRKKVSRKALRKGASIVAKSARKNIRSITASSKVTTGTLAKGIRFYNMKNYKGALRVGVMVQKGLVNEKKIINGKPVRVGLYASVLEYGKANQTPRPWLRPALDNNEGAVESVVRSTMSDGIIQEVAKLRVR